MRFEEDDLIFASQLHFLYTRQGIQNLDGTGKKIATIQKVVLKQLELKNLLSKEAELSAKHPSKPHIPDHKYRDIRLIRDQEPSFAQSTTWKKGKHKFIQTWHNFVVNFFFLKQKKIVPVAIHNCWKLFKKPQQANIVSWFKHYLSRHRELEGLYMPLFLKPASNLVGAPLGSMSHAEV